MKIKNTPLNVKKIPYYFLLGFLTLGASVILGFLSFGGMYALVPILSLAFASFGLSVAYEGEIYLQNLKGALNKLFTKNYLKMRMAKEYLQSNITNILQEDNCPTFFKDYKKQLLLLKAYDEEHLDEESKQRKEQIEKILTDMEEYFAQILFDNKASDHKSNHALEVIQYLKNTKKKNELQSEWQAKFAKRYHLFNFMKVLSVVSGVFMGMGMTYLMVEAFSVIPLFLAISASLWPFLIIPMACIAAGAYALLTYNTVTDLINNDTLNKWYTKLKTSWSKGFTWNNLFMTIGAVLLVGIAVLLTVCTAGTWWTIANEARPLFSWMAKMPRFIMGVINPIITGISSLFFNLQNTAESLERIEEAMSAKKSAWQLFKEALLANYHKTIQTENLWQLCNPFRIILKLTITPLRILLFIGHLISIAVTADRMPGIPQILAALIAFISEGFEDAHYFVEDFHDYSESNNAEDILKKFLKERLKEGHGHNHGNDVPTMILKALASLLYLLAALWDWIFSQLNPFEAPINNTAHHHHSPKEHNHSDEVAYYKVKLTFAAAWRKQRGEEEKVAVNNKNQEFDTSLDWKKEHLNLLITNYKQENLEKVVINKDIAQDQISELTVLQKEINNSNLDNLAIIVGEAQKKPIFNKHGFFEFKETSSFLADLPYQKQDNLIVVF